MSKISTGLAGTYFTHVAVFQAQNDNFTYYVMRRIFITNL